MPARWLGSLDEEPRWKAYMERLRLGEIERDFAVEAALEGSHYWTFEEAALETERLAEQLSVIALLGVRKKT